MSKQLLALAVTAAFSLALAGCSGGGGGGSSDDGGSSDGGIGTTGGDGGTTGGTTGSTTGNTGGGTTAADPGGAPPAPGGGGAPAGDTKANTYVGDFGFGNGVYVIDNNNRLSGLALSDDGSATSLFGDLGDGNSFSGPLRLQRHDASRPASAGVFGAGRAMTEVAGPYALNIVPGQSIESSGDPAVSLPVASGGQLTAATAASVAGSWGGINQYAACEGDGGCRLVTNVTFEGTSVSGSTHVENSAGESTFEQPLNGTVSEFGDVLLLSFNWGSGEIQRRYDGLAFFATDGTGRLVFVGATEDDSVGNPTIGSLLSR